MRLARLVPGAEPAAELVGGVLTRDVSVGGERWSKGRVLTGTDLERFADTDARRLGMFGGGEPHPVTVILPDAGEIHEDEAATRLALAVAGPGLEVGEPHESRVDLVASADGVVRVDARLLERINRIEGLLLFSILDGRVVSAGQLVASAKTGPHVVPLASVERAEALAGRSTRPVLSVLPLRPARIGVVVKESLAAAARERFEHSVRDKIEGLGSRLVSVEYVADREADVEAALGRLVRGPGRVDLVLTAGAASTDPGDPFYVAVGRLGGVVRSHGVPAHPGSMLWLARVRRTTILGLPTCGAYSKATAVDLLLPWLLAGLPPSRATAARLGYGGILTRDQRHRFPAYARELDAPEG
jgi:hypothetical protein